jgi:hypothetical protein
MIRHASAAAVIAIALSCGGAAAQSDEGTSGLWRWFDPRTSPFIPIPEVATDPNSGTSFGVLPIYLVTDDPARFPRQRKRVAQSITGLLRHARFEDRSDAGHGADGLCGWQ